jgi:hypothetical protein
MYGSLAKHVGRGMILPFESNMSRHQSVAIAGFSVCNATYVFYQFLRTIV